MLTFSIIFALSCIFVFGASQDASHFLGESEELARRSTKMLQEYRNHSKGHLLTTVEAEVLALHSLNANLRSFLVKKASPDAAQLEALKFQVSRVTDEFGIVSDLYANKRTTEPMTVPQMNQFAVNCISEAYNFTLENRQLLGKNRNLALFQLETIQLALFTLKLDPGKNGRLVEETLMRHSSSLQHLRDLIKKEIVKASDDLI